MTAQTPPYALQNSSHGAELFRRAISSLFGAPFPGVLSLGSIGGVVNSGDLAVAQNGTPNMSVNVAGGQVWVPGTTAANQGLYYGLNDGTLNLAIAASNPTNPRIDAVVASVNDAAYVGSTNNWVLQVLTGTPTAGATLGNLSGAPAVPASSVLLAYVLVPANSTSVVTANIADKRSLITLGAPLRLIPACRVFASTITTCASGTATQIGGFGTDFNIGSFIVTSNSVTVPMTGKYRVSGQITWQAGSSSNNQFQLIVNAVQVRLGLGGAAALPLAALTDGIALNINDVVTIYGVQASGASQNTVTGQTGTFLSLALESS